MKTKKIMAVAMAALMLMGSSLALQGCKGTGSNKDEIVIKKDDPWFSSSEVDLATLCGATDYPEYYFDQPSFSGDYILVSYQAYGYDKENDSYTNDRVLCIIDNEGKLVNKINVDEIMTVDENSFAEMYDCITEKGKLYVYFGVTNWMAGSSKLYKASIDTEKGTVGTPEEVDFGLASDERVNQMKVVGDYAFVVKESPSSCGVIVMKDGEKVLDKDLKNELQTDYAYISFAEEKEGIISLSFQATSNMVGFDYDPDANTLTKTGDSDYVFSPFGDSVIGSDGRTYVTKSSGIFVDDEEYLCYGDSDVNLSYFMNASLCSVSEDKVVMYIDDFDDITYDSIPKLVVFQKQAENPNAGKKVIKASSPYMVIDEMVAEGIKKFNSENSDYYIRMSGSSLWDDPNYEYDEEKSEQYLNDFKMKLLENDGPDIIFDADAISGIKSDEYLLDLSSDFKLDPNLYYTNITDNMLSEGKLYTMPLAFAPEGILTDKESISADKKGFTFDEYKEFVSGVCNGEDPLGDNYSRDTYLAMCLSASSDLWIKDGKADFNKEEFKKLAEFIKDNVPELSKWEEEGGDVIVYDDNYMNEMMQAKAMQISVYNAGEYLRQCEYFKDPVLLGFPSADGRGCAAYSYSAVGISANTRYKDACFEFVNIMLSEDVQMLTENNPLNRAASEKIIDDVMAKLEDQYKRNVTDQGYSEADAFMMGYTLPKKEWRDSYLEVLNNTECVYAFDDQVQKIISEEADAYFAGQKDIDSFIEILNNRVQTMLDERGK